MGYLGRHAGPLDTKGIGMTTLTPQQEARLKALADHRAVAAGVVIVPEPIPVSAPVGNEREPRPQVPGLPSAA